MSNETLPTPWQYYAGRARDAHDSAYDQFAPGREEQLDEIIDSIARGIDFTPTVVARLERVPWNRAKKHRRLVCKLQRRESVRQLTALQPPRSVKELPTLHAQHLRVERFLIAGHSYPVIARRLTTTVGALKMRVIRWRQAIRASQAG